MLPRLLIAALAIVFVVTETRPQSIDAQQSFPFGTPFSVIGTFPVGGAEIAAATPDGRYLAVTSAGSQRVTLLDLRNPAQPVETCAFDASSIGEPTSVAVHPTGRYAVTAIKADPNPGTVVAFSIPGCAELARAAVGIGPDSIVIAPNGMQAVVAIEDEETEVDDPTDCTNVRPGRVDLIGLDPRLLVGSPFPTLPGFPGFPSIPLPGIGATQLTVKPVALNLAGVVGVNCPADPQPEGIAISPDSQLAYVTLQENNALATVDLRAASVASVMSLGTTSHLADVTNDNMAVVDDPFTGRRESDGIAISQDGRWLFTADEGDTARTEPVFSGGRSMSVLRAGRTPAIVTDTGAQIETEAAANGALPTDRARNRGPEPEGITVFRAGAQEFAAVTLERSNAVILFDISNPQQPTAAAFVPTGAGPEGAVYLPVRGLLVTTNEVDGSITVICARPSIALCR